MCSFLASLDWLGLIQTLATLATAVIAFLALNTWKRQAKTERKTEVLDNLTKRTYAYIQALSRPIEFFKIIKISIESRKLPSDDRSATSCSHLIQYIEDCGKKDSERLLEYLEDSRNIAAEVESLVARGSIQDFDDYERFEQSVNRLLQQRKRLEAVAFIIRDDSLNWKNETVLEMLETVLVLQTIEISEVLHSGQLECSEFVKKNYLCIYRCA